MATESRGGSICRNLHGILLLTALEPGPIEKIYPQFPVKSVSQCIFFSRVLRFFCIHVV